MYNTVFYGASKFNADISAWRTDALTSLFASRLYLHPVTRNLCFLYFFQSNLLTLCFFFSNPVCIVISSCTAFHTASAFNADISNWTTSKVTTMRASTSTLLLCATLFLDWILFTETVVLFFFFYVSHFLVDFFVLGHHWNILQRFMKLTHSTWMFQIGSLLNVLLWNIVRPTHLIFDCVTNPIVLSETFFFVACFPPLFFGVKTAMALTYMYLQHSPEHVRSIRMSQSGTQQRYLTWYKVRLLFRSFVLPSV